MKSGPLWFGVKFIFLFAALVGAFEASRGTEFERLIVVDAILVPTTALLNIASPQERVTLSERTLVSGTSNLHVTRGCEGVELFLLLIAGILAFPASLSRRAWGLLLGGMLAYVLSVTRLVVLDETLRRAPNAWEALHGIVMSLVPVVIMAFFFLRWTASSPVAGQSRAT
jgi:exosortase family protein XrtM